MTDICLSVVYAVHLYSDRYKLGWSTGMKKRLLNYQSVVPEAEVIWTSPGNVNTEAKMFSYLAPYKVLPKWKRSSEVFSLCGDLAKAIDLIEAAYDHAVFDDIGGLSDLSQFWTGA